MSPTRIQPLSPQNVQAQCQGELLMPGGNVYSGVSIKFICIYSLFTGIRFPIQVQTVCNCSAGSVIPACCATQKSEVEQALSML